MACVGTLLQRMFDGQNKYYNDDNRVATFKSWPFDDSKKCSKTKMAEAGFIFIGSSQEPDSVECFFCGKTLDGWEENDSPFEEHYNHANCCEFAQMRKPQCEWTLDEHLKLMKAYERRQIALYCATAKKKLKQDISDIKKQTRSKK